MKNIILSILRKRLRAKSYFDVRAVTDTAEALGIDYLDRAEYRFLRAVHCVDYCAMSPEEIEATALAIASLLGAPTTKNLLPN